MSPGLHRDFHGHKRLTGRKTVDRRSHNKPGRFSIRLCVKVQILGRLPVDRIRDPFGGRALVGTCEGHVARPSHVERSGIK